MNHDRYKYLAEHYDRMKKINPDRIIFIKTICNKYDNPKILDCSCGTGKDAQILSDLGYDVTCSDYSDSMLSVCKERFKENKSVKILKADFHKLDEVFTQEFDIILCLSNSINEEDVNPYKALNSMKKVLTNKGVIIFDQGQTDYSMCNPPSHQAIVNERDFSRLMVMNYSEDMMTVDIFDFIHSKEVNDFSYSTIRVKIRLHDEWETILHEVNLNAEYYGDWIFSKYTKQTSMRMIIVAKKEEYL